MCTFDTICVLPICVQCVYDVLLKNFKRSLTLFVLVRRDLYLCILMMYYLCRYYLRIIYLLYLYYWAQHLASGLLLDCNSIRDSKSVIRPLEG